VDFLVRTGRHFRKLTPLSMIAAPLVVSDQVLGALAIFNFDEENCYSQDDFILFKSIAAQVSIAFETAHLIAELEQLALTDSLTGLYNRRHFFNLSSREFERAMRHETSLAAVMIDLDHFKRVNDTHGHAAGDQVLRAIARLCMERLRRIDIIGRYGGEEFAVVMPDTDLNDAIQAAARLGEMIAAEKIMLPQGELRVTASLGVALFERDMPNLETLLDHADQAMYAAKKAGRNRVEVYASPIADEENNLD
jgi:diguanylate cyclase (GGDEF)-like protein